MGFEGYDLWKTTAPVEREAPPVREEAPRYQIIFCYRGNTATGFVRARWEHFDGQRWTLMCSGRGVDEADAIKALRENLRERRYARLQHRPMAAWSVVFENEVAS